MPLQEPHPRSLAPRSLRPQQGLLFPEPSLFSVSRGKGMASRNGIAGPTATNSDEQAALPEGLQAICVALLVTGYLLFACLAT